MIFLSVQTVFCSKFSARKFLTFHNTRIKRVKSYERYVNVGAFAQFLSYFDSEITSLTYDNLERPRPTTTTSSTLPSRVIIEKKIKSPIEIKINDLYARLESEGYGQGPHKLKMPLERTTFLEDAFKHVMSKSKKELQRNKERGFLLVELKIKLFDVLSFIKLYFGSL